ncbi:MAG: hypothetical protein LBR98_00500 [Syntrophomonadaceae bacterium]|nr:hypothetical protein [Syntrophomonadaceae bacterium]
MPALASIVLVQNLYDILFQYAVSKEKEEKLEVFIKKLETHIKSKARAPFSMSLEEMSFLGEGLDELRLLNWQQVNLFLFEIVIDEPEQDEDVWEELMGFFNTLFTCVRINNSNVIKVFPSAMVI